MTYASVHFDMPTSANKIWQPGSFTLFRSAAYKAWRKAAGQEVMVARSGGIRFVEPVEVTIIAQRRNGRADIDNIIKASLDALQYGQPLANDCLVDSVVARWVKEHDVRNMHGRDVRVEIRSC